MSVKKAVGYGVMIAAATPFLVGSAFIAYLGYKSTKYAFKNPKTTVGVILASSIMLYAMGCNPKKTVERLGNAVCDTVDAVVTYNMQSLEQSIDQYPASKKEPEERQEETVRQKPLYEEKPIVPQQYMTHKVLPKENSVAHNDDTVEKNLERDDTERTTYAATDNHLKFRPIKSPLETMTSQRYNFYFTKPSDTLQEIAQKVSGDETNSRLIAKDNGIESEYDLVTGQLLKLRKTICKNETKGVYRRVPKLQSVLLPGRTDIADYFGCCSPLTFQTIALNEYLGLPGNNSPHKERPRVVYYW